MEKERGTILATSPEIMLFVGLSLIFRCGVRSQQMRVRMGFHIKSKAGPNIGDCLKKKGQMNAMLSAKDWMAHGINHGK